MPLDIVTPAHPHPADGDARNGSVGAWRSLVAHLHGVQGVVGSNPIAPTITVTFRAVMTIGDSRQNRPAFALWDMSPERFG